MKKKRKFPPRRGAVLQPAQDRNKRVARHHNRPDNQIRNASGGESERAELYTRIHQAKPGHADDGRRRKSEVCRTK